MEAPLAEVKTAATPGQEHRVGEAKGHCLGHVVSEEHQELEQNNTFLLSCRRGPQPSRLDEGAIGHERRSPESTPYRDTEHHAVFDIAALGNQRATGKRQAQLQREGVAGKPPKAPTLCSSHPSPRTPQAAPPRRTRRSRRRRRPINDLGLSSGSGVGGGEEGPQPRLQGGRTAPKGVAVTGSDKPA